MKKTSWNMILKVIIAVITAIAGVIGVQAMTQVKELFEISRECKTNVLPAIFFSRLESYFSIHFTISSDNGLVLEP